MLSEIDQKLLKIAYEEAKEGFEEGGCPIGSVLARDGKIIAQGRNQRVQSRNGRQTTRRARSLNPPKLQRPA